MKPLILVSNDDGYQAKGIQTLVEALRPLARLVVVAPDTGRSGMACACTFNVPVYKWLVSSDDDVSVWGCSGTPVDCVKLAFADVLTERPAMVIGGINHGDNSAVNTHYSGTMGVVYEGCMKGIPSVAFSLDSHDPFADFSPLVPWIQRITSYVLEHGLPKGTCLNVNFPTTTPYKGIRFCRMAWGEWKSEFERRDHPRGGDYYWLTGHFELNDSTDGYADRIALNEGYVAVTPFKLDATDYALKAELEKVFSAHE
jgi:5'-nucleotidase